MRAHISNNKKHFLHKGWQTATNISQDNSYFIICPITIIVRGRISQRKISHNSVSNLSRGNIQMLRKHTMENVLSSMPSFRSIFIATLIFGEKQSTWLDWISWRWVFYFNIDFFQEPINGLLFFFIPSKEARGRIVAFTEILLYPSSKKKRKKIKR